MLSYNQKYLKKFSVPCIQSGIWAFEIFEYWSQIIEYSFEHYTTYMNHLFHI